MRLKTFAAATMADAMRAVRDELGEDAIIVASVPEEHGQGVRVTAAAEHGAAPVAEPPQDDALDDDLFADRDAPDDLPDDPPWARRLDVPEPEEAEPETRVLVAVRQALVAHGVDGRLRQYALEAAEDAIARQDGLDAQLALAAGLDACLRFDPLPAAGHDRPVMLLGLPGTGKTSAVAKLAARARLNGTSVRVISTDTTRAGGVAQLQALTEAMQVGLRLAHDPEELATTVAGAAGTAGSGLIVIDTPAVNPFDAGELAALGALTRASDLEPVLVHPAGLDAADSVLAAEALATLGCRRMIVTRLDLAKRCGSVLAAARAANLAIADGSVAPTIGNGLTPLNPVALARLMLPPAAAEPQHTGTHG